MTTTTFPIDPGDMPALKRWLAAQESGSENIHSHLHPVEIDEILIGPDVLRQLPGALQRAGIDLGSPLVLVMDETPMLRGRDDLKLLVQSLLNNAGYHVRPLWLAGDHHGLVHADFEQVQRVQAAITPQTALIALGSGTVTDITKHAAYLYDLAHPGQARSVYICCQTANSVTAFSANMAVLLKDGVKRTLPSRYPTAIISDLGVLASAPKAMTLAGLGDCCARFVAYGDWYLASALGMVAPISGTEHVTSHVLDMIADHYRRGLALHGAQVGVATITAAQLYQRFLATFDPRAVDIDACYPGASLIRTHVQQLFRQVDPGGAMARECWHDYSEKLLLWRSSRMRFAHFCAHWHSLHRPKLASLVCSPHIVHTILAQAGAPLGCQDLQPVITQQEYNFAVQNGHFIRKRFVLGDLLYFLGWSV